MDTKSPGTLIISLDFELMWGMFDKVTLDTYGQNIAAVHEVIPRLLELFAERDIHATWATVGMLMYESKTALLAARPKAAPHYARPELSSYQHLETASITETDQHYFAPGVVKQICNTPGQELASHTFSHFYTLEAETSSEGEAFAADCTAMQLAADHFDSPLTSIVFPRNQWTEAALREIQNHGLSIYRGTEDHFLYRARTDREQNHLLIRGLRLLDHYVNLSGHHTYTLSKNDGLTNLPSSRFLRPYNAHLSFLESLRLRRIKRSMTHAAKHGEMFHLWWHPHNFGNYTEENFKILINLLDHYQHLHKHYGMRSANMQEAATQNDEYIV